MPFLPLAVASRDVRLTLKLGIAGVLLAGAAGCGVVYAWLVPPAVNPPSAVTLAALRDAWRLLGLSLEPLERDDDARRVGRPVLLAALRDADDAGRLTTSVGADAWRAARDDYRRSGDPARLAEGLVTVVRRLEAGAPALHVPVPGTDDAEPLHPGAIARRLLLVVEVVRAGSALITASQVADRRASSEDGGLVRLWWALARLEDGGSAVAREAADAGGATDAGEGAAMRFHALARQLLAGGSVTLATWSDTGRAAREEVHGSVEEALAIESAERAREEAGAATVRATLLVVLLLGLAGGALQLATVALDLRTRAVAAARLAEGLMRGEPAPHLASNGRDEVGRVLAALEDLGGGIRVFVDDLDRLVAAHAAGDTGARLRADAHLPCLAHAVSRLNALADGYGAREAVLRLVSARMEAGHAEPRARAALPARLVRRSYAVATVAPEDDWAKF